MAGLLQDSSAISKVIGHRGRIKVEMWYDFSKVFGHYGRKVMRFSRVLFIMAGLW